MATQLTRPTATSRRSPFLDALGRLSPDERLAVYRSGGFTPRECHLWAANYPEEPPIVNGEFEWIALRLADLD